MEPKHKELLEKCYQNLVESITDADRLVECLAHGGALSQSERFELGHGCSSSPEKVDLLLKILLSKDRDHFGEFCAALEKTHPHLHSALLGDAGPVDHTTGKTTCVYYFLKNTVIQLFISGNHHETRVQWCVQLYYCDAWMTTVLVIIQLVFHRARVMI